MATLHEDAEDKALGRVIEIPLTSSGEHEVQIF